MGKYSETFLNFGLLWMRVLMGVGIARHGFGKVFGGGMEGFAEGVAAMGFPVPLAFAWAAALSELLGGIIVVLGFGTRIGAFFVFSLTGVRYPVRHPRFTMLP